MLFTGWPPSFVTLVRVGVCPSVCVLLCLPAIVYSPLYPPSVAPYFWCKILTSPVSPSLFPLSTSAFSIHPLYIHPSIHPSFPNLSILSFLHPPTHPPNPPRRSVGCSLLLLLGDYHIPIGKAYSASFYSASFSSCCLLRRQTKPWYHHRLTEWFSLRNTDNDQCLCILSWLMVVGRFQRTHTFSLCACLSSLFPHSLSLFLSPNLWLSFYRRETDRQIQRETETHWASERERERY